MRRTLTFFFFPYSLSLPSLTETTGTNPLSAATHRYALLTLYWWIAAIQLRHGYEPALPMGAGRGKSSIGSLFRGYGSLPKYVFKVFMLIPFLFELKQVLDWACIPTSLDLFMWLKQQSLFASLFTTKCEMERRRKDGGYVRGRARAWVEKAGQGSIIIAVILFVLVGPIFVYSPINPTQAPNQVSFFLYVSVATLCESCLQFDFPALIRLINNPCQLLRAKVDIALVSIDESSDSVTNAYPLYVADRSARIDAVAALSSGDETFTKLQLSLLSSSATGTQSLLQADKANTYIVQMEEYSSAVWSITPVRRSVVAPGSRRALAAALIQMYCCGSKDSARRASALQSLTPPRARHLSTSLVPTHHPRTTSRGAATCSPFSTKSAPMRSRRRPSTLSSP